MAGAVATRDRAVLHNLEIDEGRAGGYPRLRTDSMKTSSAMILAVVAAVLVVAVVILYGLVARKMYDKDKQLLKRQKTSSTRKETSGNADKP
jgi:cell division protein FtsL